MRPITKGRIPCDATETVRLIETESGMVVARTGGVGMGSCYLMGREFQFGKM